MRSQSKIFAKRVDDLMQGAEICVGLGTSCADVVKRLSEQGAHCCLVVDGYGKLAGMLRLHDILKNVVFKVTQDTPVEDVMVQDFQTVLSGEYLYHAIGRMRRHNVAEIVVVDMAKRPVGVIYYEKAVEAAASHLISRIDRLSGEGNIASLRGVKAAQVDIARQMFDDKVSFTYVQRLLSHVNSDICARIVVSNLAHMEAEGWGEAPVGFCVIVMGSGGRGENYLNPDQDNGFILEDYPDEDHNRVDHFFRELARRMCDDLDAVGFPYCRGNVMATNPLWRKSVSQWCEQVQLWGRKRNRIALQLADIFFDFQPVWGQMELAKKVKDCVLKAVKTNHFFLQEMFYQQSEHSVALGLFGRLSTEVGERGEGGQIDLKYRAILPLVEGVRLLSLKHGIEETCTLERLEALHACAAISDTEADYLASAFGFITRLLLQRQVNAYGARKPVSRFVALKSLSKREKESLQNAFRHIDGFRKRLKGEFTGDVF